MDSKPTEDINTVYDIVKVLRDDLDTVNYKLSRIYRIIDDAFSSSTDVVKSKEQSEAVDITCPTLYDLLSDMLVADSNIKNLSSDIEHLVRLHLTNRSDEPQVGKN